MTTAAAPRRPSPADVARQASAAADQRLITPGTLPPGMAVRALYERAILTSGLRPHSRLVAMALATHATAAGDIPAGSQPRLTGLVHDTGLHAGQVVVALNTLKSRGWIRQARPRDPYDAADLVLLIPSRVLTRLRTPATTPTTETPDHA